MTRQNFLRNPRVITISLLVLTFILAAVAIITAITLQRRQNVNPTPGQASECKCPEQGNIDKSKRDYEAWKDANPGQTDSNWENEIKQAEARCDQWKKANCTGSTNLLKCNEFIDSDNTHDPKSCGAGQVKNCAVYSKTCNGTEPGDPASTQVKCSSCYTPGGTSPTPLPDVPLPTISGGWVYETACRYRTGGGECAKAEFKNCNPGPGKMCICRGNDRQGGDGWTYANQTTEDFSNGKCGADCSNPADAGRRKNASECNNPYRCPGTPPTSTPTATPTPPPPPNCNEGCVGKDWVMTCDGKEVNRIPNYPSCQTECKQTQKCEGSDYVKRDCNGKEISRQKDYPACKPTTSLPQCISAYIDVDGNKNKTLAPGEFATIYTTILNPTNNSGVVIPMNRDNLYTSNNIPKPALLPIKSVAGYAPMEVHPGGDGGSLSVIWFTSTGNNAAPIRTFVWKVRYDQIFQADSNNGGKELTRAQLNSYVGGMTNSDANCIVNLNKSTPSSTPTPTPTSTPTPSTAYACTGISVKNNRNGVTCDKNTNPTNCDLKQGDSLAVTVSGSNVTQYRVQPNWVSTQSTFSTSATSTVQIPTTALTNNAISIQGYVNTSTGTAQGGAACLFTAQFSNVPKVEKTIDVAGSTSLVNGTSNPVIVDQNSTVKYDVYVKNTGSSGVLHNVIAVDSLSAYDASGNQIGTAFGNITGAENLVRTVGTKSDPSSVAPRVPTGNTYATSANVKSVEWNKINNLYYGETYHAKVTVDVLAGTAVLRNNVCLYEDTVGNNGKFDYTDVNNNGKYDYGVDTPLDKLLDCNHVDVATSIPEYTIEKTAIQETGTDPVQVIEPGDTFRYQVTLKNTSTSNTLNLSGVTVTDTFDSNFVSKFDFVTLPTGATQNGSTITWPATADQSDTSLAPGESAIYYMKVQVKSSFFDSNANCSEAITNNVKASSTSPNHTTPTYTVYVTVMNNPACEPTPVPSTTPNTGLPTVDFIKYLGIGLVVAAVTMYLFAENRRQRSPLFVGRMPTAQNAQRTNGLNEKLSDIISRLKNK